MRLTAACGVADRLNMLAYGDRMPRFFGDRRLACVRSLVLKWVYQGLRDEPSRLPNR
jgi:hypothetical protein